MSAALPFVALAIDGARNDTYRGAVFPQASVVASTSGLGDVIVRAKYHVIRNGGGGLAIGGDLRTPTGDAANLLGAGRWVATPRLMASLEHARLALDGEIGYAAGGALSGWQYGGALTMAPGARVTLVAEVVGRRLSEGGHLVETVEPNPSLSGVDTIRLASDGEPTSRLSVVAGVRWNVASRWLLSW